MKTNLEWAKYYVFDRQWSVIPLSPKSKIPPKGFEVLPFRERFPTIEELEEWFSNPKTNIGIITGKLSNLFVVDLDKYKEQYQEENALLHFGDSINVPVVRTPRGGEHLFFEYPGHGITIGEGILPAIDYRGEGGYVVCPPSITEDGTYQWIQDCTKHTVGQCNQSLINIINKNSLYTCDIPPTKTVVTSVIICDKRDIWESGIRDKNLFHVAHCLTQTKNSEEYIRQILRALVISWGETDERWINAKVKSAMERQERRERNIQAEVDDWISRTEGDFSVTNMRHEMIICDKRDMVAARQALSRRKDITIEKVGCRDGWWRKINKDLKKIDLADKSDLHGELFINFPFGIEELIKPMPGCIYVIAGETDTGKSAFLMNFAKKNIENYKVHYFSTEMGKQEFLDRTNYFWPDVDSHQNFNFYERYEDFDQVIFPDDINIIDYLELFTDFYKMAGAIKNIGRALKNGIAFIALQKPRGREEGEGGERTKNLPRLYLSLSPNNLKIVKAKNWRYSKINPNKLEIEFKLIEGCKFTNITSWKRKEIE